MASLSSCKEKFGLVRLALAAPDALNAEGICRVLQGLPGADQGERIYVWSQLAPDVLITACRGGTVQWWEAMAAQAYFGQLNELRTLHAAMTDDLGKGAKVDVSTTMTWTCWNYSNIDGISPAFNTEVLDQLFDWGADPMYKGTSNETYYEKSLRTAPAAIVRSFLQHGAPLQLAMTVRDSLLAKGGTAQAAEIQQALGLGGFFTKVDNQTLMEIKYISEPGRGSSLRTIFNFGARRVNEIFEPQGAASTMTSCNFEDYDANALDIAARTLEKLGGAPQAAFCLLDKKKRPHL